MSNKLTLSENSDSPCDTGSALETLSTEFPDLDFSKIDRTFPSKALDTPYAFTRSAIMARGQSCLQKLYPRQEKVIAVVTHSAFLRTSTSKRRFANADYRIFTFRKQKDGHLTLVEDSSTSQNGGGMGRSPIGFQPIEDWDFPPENVVEVEGNA
jgi:broad specificity phosphatase PhoE